MFTISFGEYTSNRNVIFVFAHILQLQKCWFNANKLEFDYSNWKWQVLLIQLLLQYCHSSHLMNDCGLLNVGKNPWFMWHYLIRYRHTQIESVREGEKTSKWIEIIYIFSHLFSPGHCLYCLSLSIYRFDILCVSINKNMFHIIWLDS